MTLTPTPVLRRRSLLRLTLAATAGAGLAACGTSSPAPSASSASPSATNPEPSPSMPSTTTSGRSRVLLAYFSRAGENYHNGGRRTLQVGNTKVVATMIANAITCDVHEIIAAEPYSDSYDATVARNVREQNTDARPEITDLLASIDQYDTVLLGSPIWNVRPPMIMSTFTSRFDFTGKTVFPLVTFAVSGMGQAEDVYRQSCPGATIAEGLAVRGEEATSSRSTVEGWLQRAGLS